MSSRISSSLFQPDEAVSLAVQSGTRPTNKRPSRGLLKNARMLMMAGAIGLAALTSAMVPGTAQAQDYNTSGRVYNQNGALSQQNVQMGTIVGMRSVTIKSTQRSQLGSAIGRAVGGAVGYQATSHANSTWRSVLGALGGGYIGGEIGNAIGKSTHTKHGVQLFVRMQRTGQVNAYVQDNDQPFRVGETVTVVRSNNGFAVTPVAVRPQQIRQHSTSRTTRRAPAGPGYARVP